MNKIISLFVLCFLCPSLPFTALHATLTEEQQKDAKTKHKNNVISITAQLLSHISELDFDTFNNKFQSLLLEENDFSLKEDVIFKLYNYTLKNYFVSPNTDTHLKGKFILMHPLIKNHLLQNASVFDRACLNPHISPKILIFILHAGYHPITINGHQIANNLLEEERALRESKKSLE